MSDIEGALFYTLRKAGALDKPTFELTKWSDLSVTPLDVYAQWLPQRSDGLYNVTSCNCPSRQNPCKHAAISLALLEAADTLPRNLPFHYWAEGQTHRVKDLPE